MKKIFIVFVCIATVKLYGSHSELHVLAHDGEQAAVHALPQEAERGIKTHDDILAKMSLLQLNNSVQYVHNNVQDSLFRMQSEQNLMHVNAINMHENRSYLDIVERPEYLSYCIHALQQYPYLAQAQDESIIISAETKNCCQSLCYLKANIQDLNQHIAWFQDQRKACSYLMMKADRLINELALEQNNLSAIIQSNWNNDVASIYQTLYKQVDIEREAQYYYQVDASEYQQYGLMARYYNAARLKKAATMIQAQTRKLLAQNSVLSIKKDKAVEQISKELLDDVTANMMHVESLMAYVRQEFLEQKSAIAIQALVRKFLVQSHSKKVASRLKEVVEQTAQASLAPNNQLSKSQKRRIKQKNKNIKIEDELVFNALIGAAGAENESASASNHALQQESNDIAKQSLKDLVMHKNDLDLYALANFMERQKEENVRAVLKKAVQNSDKFHNPQLWREQIQKDIDSFDEKQVDDFEEFVEKISLLHQLTDEYRACAQNYNVQNLKSVKADWVSLCAKADTYNDVAHIDQTHLRTLLDDFDQSFHHDMVICLGLWMRTVDSYDFDNIVVQLSAKKSQLEQLQEQAKQLLVAVQQSKEQKDKDAYKAVLQKIAVAQKEYTELDRQNDQCEIAAMIHALHAPDGSLSINFLSNKQKEVYTNLLEQPISLPLQKMMQDIEAANIRERLYGCTTEQDVLTLLVPHIEKYVHPFVMLATSSKSFAQDALKMALQQAQFAKHLKIDKNNLPAWLNENGMIWFHSSILVNASRTTQHSQKQLVQTVQLKRYLIDLLYE